MNTECPAIIIDTMRDITRAQVSHHFTYLPLMTQKSTVYTEFTEFIWLFMHLNTLVSASAKLNQICSFSRLNLYLCLDWPSSQGSQGLPQAAPRVEQHSDFSVAPLMLTSQRLSCIVSQQVLFILSVEPKQQQKWHLVNKLCLWSFSHLNTFVLLSIQFSPVQLFFVWGQNLHRLPEISKYTTKTMMLTNISNHDISL